MIDEPKVLAVEVHWVVPDNHKRHEFFEVHEGRFGVNEDGYMISIADGTTILVPSAAVRFIIVHHDGPIMVPALPRFSTS